MTLNEQFAADIRHYRDECVCAALAVLEAGQPADVMERAACEAGMHWDVEHPQYLASRIEVAS